MLPPPIKKWAFVTLSIVLLTGSVNAQISGSSHHDHHHQHQDEHEDRQRHGDECNPKYLQQLLFYSSINWISGLKHLKSNQLIKNQNF